MLRFVLFAALALVAAPAFAQSDTGYVVGDADLRAGPDFGYPLIDVVPAGGPVYINGCTEAYEWCDVVFQDEHGWVAGNTIQFDYDNRPVYLPRYGAAIGIPIIGFTISNYWGRYYAGRPFYRERDHWYREPPRHGPPRRPAGSPDRQPYRPVYRQPPRVEHFPSPYPDHRLPPGAMRPTAGPVRALPRGRVDAPRSGDQSDRGEHRDDRGEHRDNRGGQHDTQDH